MYCENKEEAIKLERRRNELLAKEIEKYELKEQPVKTSKVAMERREKHDDQNSDEKYDSSGYKIKNKTLLDEDFADFIKDEDDQSDDPTLEFNESVSEISQAESNDDFDD
jgi:hypothetical protein